MYTGCQDSKVLIVWLSVALAESVEYALAEFPRVGLRHRAVGWNRNFGWLGSLHIGKAAWASLLGGLRHNGDREAVWENRYREAEVRQRRYRKAEAECWVGYYSVFIPHTRLYLISR